MNSILSMVCSACVKGVYHLSDCTCQLNPFTFRLKEGRERKNRGHLIAYNINFDKFIPMDQTPSNDKPGGGVVCTLGTFIEISFPAYIIIQRPYKVRKITQDRIPPSFSRKKQISDVCKEETLGRSGDRWSNRKGKKLPAGGSCNRNKELTPRRKAERADTPDTQSGSQSFLWHAQFLHMSKPEDRAALITIVAHGAIVRQHAIIRNVVNQKFDKQ